LGDVHNEAVVGVVRRNSHQVIRVSVADYANKPYVYAKIYEDPPNDDPRHPGLTMKAETVLGLLPLLAEAAEICECREKASLNDGREGRRRR